MHRVILFIVTAVLLVPRLTCAQPVEAESPESDNAPILMIDPDGFSGRSIRDIAISPDGQFVAVAGGKVVRVWNVRTQSLQATLRGELLPSVKKGRANAVAFSPDGRFLIVGVSDSTEAGSTRCYAMSNLNQVHSLIGGHTACTDRAIFSPDGKWLVSYG